MKTNLEIIMSIIFGFVAVNIVRLLCMTLLLAESFSSIVVDCDGVLVQLGLNILLVDERNQFPTFT